VTPPGKLDGKTALVTGGGRGIGRGIVLEFAREGADVAINYRRDRDSAERTAAEVREFGRRAIVLPRTSRTARRSTRLSARRSKSSVGWTSWSRIRASRPGRHVADVDPAEWRRVLGTDLDRRLLDGAAAIPHVVAAKGAFPLHLLDRRRHDRAGGRPLPCRQAGGERPHQVLAKEVAHTGTRVNCIAPGLVRSDMGERLLRFHGEVVLQGSPSDGPGNPPTIGRAAVFLASEDSGWITGKILRSTAARGCRVGEPTSAIDKLRHGRY